MPRREARAQCCIRSIMSAQSRGEARSLGALPPALSTLPTGRPERAEGEATQRSIWAIWAAFSLRVMRESKSRTRDSTGCVASRYGGSSSFAIQESWRDNKGRRGVYKDAGAAAPSPSPQTSRPNPHSGIYKVVPVP